MEVDRHHADPRRDDGDLPHPRTVDAVAAGSVRIRRVSLIFIEPLPFGVLSAWVDRWVIVAALAMFVPIFLAYPNDRPPSPRWRWVMVLTTFGSVPGSVPTMVAFALTPERLRRPSPNLPNILRSRLPFA